MALKKDYRKDNTYIISSDVTDNPKLGAKVLSDGRESLFLDYYFGYQMVYSERLDKQVARKDRRREYLSLYLLHNPKSSRERIQNKETLDLAKKLRFERGQELLESKEGYRLKKNRDVNFLDFFQNYIDHYTKKDKRNMILAKRRFQSFLKHSAYQRFERTLKPTQVTKDLVSAFAERLQEDCKGEGARSIFARFSKFIRYAVEHDILVKNPCAGISIKVDDNILKKDILSQEEIKTLAATHYEHENPNIRRAFLFSLLSGVRFCDIISLKFSENIDFPNKLLKFEQNKTKGHSANSSVVIPLRDDMLKLIGKPQNESDREELIFKLPSHTMCNKALKHWVKRAGINKKITWHCARHSFGTNLLVNGANIKTVATLLGHSGLRHVEKYVRCVDSLKQAAINSLPDLSELDI